MGRFELRREPWWREEGISRLVAGVFEGGGAKGILYRGALEAMVEDRERPTWFAAAAGASAGAITATLVAAGLRPERIADETDRGRAALEPRPGPYGGALRLRNGASYLDQDGLLAWLRDVLACQLGELTGAEGGETVTFEELHQLTGIELDVVAVDLERQRPVVFNHALTPRCQVAEAVLASAAIPLAFEWLPLAVPGPEAGPYGRIVDGGVISNFPRFVFTDRSFREWAGLEPVPERIPVVGFLLDEQSASDAAGARVYTESRFGERRGSRPFRARRPSPGPAARAVALLSWPLRKLARLVGLVLLGWLPAALRWNAGGARGSWPPPRNPTAARLLGWYDALMTAIRPPGVFVVGFGIATLTLAYGAYRVGWLPLARVIDDGVAGRLALGDAWTILYLLVVSVVPVYAWLLLTLLFAGGWLLHRTVQETGYGLLRTFLQNPAAPPWAGTSEDDLVAKLPVPEGLTTLAVGLNEQELEAALEQAREATRAVLRRLGSREAVPG